MSAAVRLLLVALLAALAPRALADSGPSREYQLKAAFLFNFAQFVEWPASAFAADDAPLRIGVLGEDPFGAALDEVVRGETVRGRKLAVQRAARVDELKDCQVVFVSRSEKARVADIIAAFDGKPVLSVSDIDGFAAKGGIIRFFLEGNRIRFEINQGAAQEHGLKLSAQLLGLGRIVGSADKGERR